MATRARTLAAVMVCFSTSACAGRVGRTVAPATAVLTPHRPAEAAAPKPAGAVPDARIVKVLLNELDEDATVCRESIEVAASDGVVTLRGTVVDPLAKERAVDIARVVRGVRGIVDRVVVTPDARPDQELDFAVASTLANDTVTGGERIAAQAHEGLVLLSGDVDSQATHRVAVADVLGMRGVRGVIDALAVRPQYRSDQRLAAEIARVVRDDPWLDDEQIVVSADAGVVRLAGRVGSAAERARAENDARTATPDAVDASGLSIEAHVDDGTLRALPATTPADADLAEALRDAYRHDPRLGSFAPSATVRNGVVLLSGIAPGPEVARAATDDAGNLPGVIAVHDALAPGQPPLGVASMQR